MKAPKSFPRPPFFFSFFCTGSCFQGSIILYTVYKINKLSNLSSLTKVSIPSFPVTIPRHTTTMIEGSPEESNNENRLLCDYLNFQSVFLCY